MIPQNLFKENLIQTPPRRLRKQPPARLDPPALLNKVADSIHEFEVRNTLTIFYDLYKAHYNLGFVVLGRKVDITATKKILAICRLRNWPVKDFIEYNVLWFKKFSKYRALPVHLCGSSAEEKYESFLRLEGYIDEFNPSASKRIAEVTYMEATKRRKEELGAQNMLPQQAEEAACRYADAQAASVDTPDTDVPSWMHYTREALIERHRAKVWAMAKAEYMCGWRKATNGSAQGRQLY